MAKPKTAPVESTLIGCKGTVEIPSEEKPREDPIALTVKLDPKLYFQLKRRGMGTKPRKSDQALIVEAIKAYLG